ncbi:PASTA domain-containing protein [Streptococcus suis]|uniref:PASTA domain-containing protein n=1 Tax=Streptococcus suis TaxID=1307 RepID=UPI003AF8A384
MAPQVVPNVVGKSQENATQVLQTAGFSVGTITQEYSSSVTAGQVISTDPVAHTELAKGSIINLVISKGKELVMPDLTSRNYTYSQARSQLQALGVNAENIEKQEDRSYYSTTSDIVIGQYPAAGATIDGTVTLYVSVASTRTSSDSSTGSSTSTSTSTDSGQ